MTTSILKKKGMVPFLAVAFLNAFTDLGHKIILNSVVFKHMDGSLQMAWTTVINALVLLPFILTFTPAGFISDKYSKARVMKWAALLAVGLTLLIYWNYAGGSFTVGMVLLFLLAFQSAIYGPAKLGYLKELVGTEKLAMGNGLLQSIVIAAILLGSFLFSFLFEWLYPPGGTSGMSETLQIMKPLGLLLVGCAVVEWILVMFLPTLRRDDTSATFHWKAYLSGAILRVRTSALFKRREVFTCMVGLGLFWGINQVLLASFPPFFKEVTGSHNVALALGIAALAGVGIMAGSLTLGKLSGRSIEVGLLPLGFAGMFLCLILMPLTRSAALMAPVIFLYGFFGGFLVVPFNALIQFQTGASKLGEILAGKNFLEKVIMLFFLGGSLGLALYQVPLGQVFRLLAFILLAGTVYILWRMPQGRLRMQILFKQRCYPVLDIEGLDKIPAQGGLILLAGEVPRSQLPWIALALPRPIAWMGEAQAGSEAKIKTLAQKALLEEKVVMLSLPRGTPDHEEERFQSFVGNLKTPTFTVRVSVPGDGVRKGLFTRARVVLQSKTQNIGSSGFCV